MYCIQNGHKDFRLNIKEYKQRKKKWIKKLFFLIKKKKR